MPEEVIVEVPEESEGIALSEKGTGSPFGTGQPEQGASSEMTEKKVERVEGKYQELLSKVTPTKVAFATDDDHEDTVMLDAKHIGAMTDEASKVQKLLDLASTKGVVHAVKVARSLKDYYALDRMHDELSDQLYQGLLEQGLIEKE